MTALPAIDWHDVEQWQSHDDAELGRYAQLAAALLGAAELDKLPNPDPLVDRVLYRDSLAWVQGKPGHAKTFGVIDMAACVASGRDWHGYPVHQGLVLYIIAEGARGVRARVRAWEDGHGVRLGDEIRFLPVPVQFLDRVDHDALRRLARELQPVLIVVDTQARVTVGADENSSRDMGVFVDAAEALRRECGACVLIVHHEGRGGEHMRGSTALEGAATTIVRFTKDGPLVTVECRKQKDEEPFEEIALRLVPLGASAVLSHEAVGLNSVVTDSEHQLISVLRNSFGTTGATTTELEKASGLPRTSFFRAKKALISKGLLRDISTSSRPRYVLATDFAQTEVPDGSN